MPWRRGEAAGAGLLVHPGLGLVYAIFRWEGEGERESLDRALAAVDHAAREGGGHLLLEELPMAAKPARDVFDVDPPSLELMRTLKQRFDPAGILNPGRFAGRL